MAAFLHRGVQWRYRKWILMPDGTKRRITGTPAINTKRAAEDAEREHINRILHPERVQPPEPTEPGGKAKAEAVPTVRAFIPRVIKGHAPDGKPSGRASRNEALEGPIASYFGPYRLDEIDQAIVNGFIGMYPRTVASQTVKNKLNALRALLRFARGCKDLGPERWQLGAGIEWTVAKRSTVKIRAVTDAEFSALLKAAKSRPRYTAALYLARENGLRIGEIRGAQWTDIRGKSIRITRSIDEDDNIGSTKTGEPRDVPLSTATLRALAKLPRHGIWIMTREPDADAGGNGQPRVSPPGGFLGYSGMSKIIRKIYKAAGIAIGRSSDVHPWHSLRHAYGTELAAAGVKLRTIADLMGHSDVRTTLIYQSSTDEDKAAAVARVFG